MRISDWSSDVCSSDLTILAIYGNLDVRTVGDMGELPSTIPSFFIPNVPFTFETLQIIFPFSLTMAAVGLLESMMTARSEEHTSELQSLMRISYAVFCLKKKNTTIKQCYCTTIINR